MCLGIPAKIIEIDPSKKGKVVYLVTTRNNLILARGDFGLATILSELAEKTPYSLVIEEKSIPLSDAVRGAAEILGIDPLYLACEGRAVLIVPQKLASQVLGEIRQNRIGIRARVIGQVGGKSGMPGELLLSTLSGGLRLLEPLTSELLPRIC